MVPMHRHHPSTMKSPDGSIRTDHPKDHDDDARQIFALVLSTFTLLPIGALGRVNFWGNEKRTESLVNIPVFDGKMRFVLGIENVFHYHQSRLLNSSSGSKGFGTYDFVIAGGGTAGGVLANRLTEVNFTVLLLEAGQPDPAIAKVLGLNPYLYLSNFNWGYNTTSQRNSCLGYVDNRCDYPRGQGLGGSSIINSGVYARGNAKDYDDWAALGNSGWSYEEVLPYFIKSERADFRGTIDTGYHGFSGVQSIDIPFDTPNYTVVLVEAFEEFGKPELDYNGRSQNGVGRVQFYLDYNVRTSTSYSYIRPALHRPNFFVQLESLVTKVLLSPERVAYGVEFIHKGQTYNATARKEVIVSAGSINSPQLLMLSGIGPAAHLEELGIKIVADLPVGQHLEDHVIYNLVFYRAKNVLYDTDDLLVNLQRWRQAKRPLMASIDLQTVSFFQCSTEKTEDDAPDIEILAGKAVNGLFRTTPETSEAFQQINTTTDISLNVILLHPKSVGNVTLQSKDPRDFPLINPNYFDDERDLEMMYDGIQKAIALNDTKVFREQGFEFFTLDLPGCNQYDRMSREWWYCSLKALASTSYHPVGTTKMGVSPQDSVVDNQLKVHGVRNLRVVDAGVIPTHISGHTNAPVVMLAEKIADIIKLDNNYQVDQ